VIGEIRVNSARLSLSREYLPPQTMRIPPKPRHVDPTATPRTHGVEPRCIQTSGSGYFGFLFPSILLTVFRRGSVFGLPAELVVGILSHFGDPHRNIRHERSGRGSGVLVLEHVERLAVIRKLTMTCWHLRNMLLPLLWEYVEGCNFLGHRPFRYQRAGSDQMVPLKNRLYDQCSYLIRNPKISAYVQ